MLRAWSRASFLVKALVICTGRSIGVLPDYLRWLILCFPCCENSCSLHGQKHGRVLDHASNAWPCSGLWKCASLLLKIFTALRFARAEVWGCFLIVPLVLQCSLAHFVPNSFQILFSCLKTYLLIQLSINTQNGIELQIITCWKIS